MPRYKVLTNVTYQKTLTVYADDEDEAKEKAGDIAGAWSNVHEAEGVEAEEE